MYLSGNHWKNNLLIFMLKLKKINGEKDVIHHKEVVIDGIRDTIRCKVLILYVVLDKLIKKLK